MIILVDLSIYLHAHYWVLTKEGKLNQDTLYNNIKLSLKTLLVELNKTMSITHMFLCADSKSFRHKNFDYYKAHRPKDPVRKKLFKKVTKELGGVFDLLKFKDLEGDDILYLASRYCKNSILVSSDRDILQCIEEGVTVYQPSKKEFIDLDIYGDKKASLVLTKIIKGDTKDNVPRATTLGRITSQRLTGILNVLGNKITSYKKLKDALDRTATPYDKDQLKDNWELIVYKNKTYKKYIPNFKDLRNIIGLDMVY